MRVLERVLEMSNPEICRHFEKLQISLLQFTFRWCLCLMAREFTPRNVILLWDMYLADSHLLGFPVFHVYICAAFLKMFSSLVLEMGDMEKGLYLLQKPPTQYWDEYNIRELVRSHFDYYVIYVMRLKRCVGLASAADSGGFPR